MFPHFTSHLAPDGATQLWGGKTADGIYYTEWCIYKEDLSSMRIIYCQKKVISFALGACSCDSGVVMSSFFCACLILSGKCQHTRVLTTRRVNVNNSHIAVSSGKRWHGAREVKFGHTHSSTWEHDLPTTTILKKTLFRRGPVIF